MLDSGRRSPVRRRSLVLGSGKQIEYGLLSRANGWVLSSPMAPTSSLFDCKATVRDSEFGAIWKHRFKYAGKMLTSYESISGQDAAIMIV
jgi:hypothetical protein